MDLLQSFGQKATCILNVFTAGLNTCSIRYCVHPPSEMLTDSVIGVVIHKISMSGINQFG